MQHPSRRRGVAAVALVTGAALALSAPGAATGDPSPGADETRPIGLDLEELSPEVVVVRAADVAAVERLVHDGWEVVEEAHPTPDGALGVQLVATRSEQARLEAMGFPVLDVLLDGADVAALRADREARLAEVRRAEALDVDELSVLRAEWFTSVGGDTYLNLEVRSTAGVAASTVVTATYDGTTLPLSRFVDAGEYQYHRVSAPVPVDAVPDEVTFTSSAGGTATAPLTQWLGDDLKPPGPAYATGFVDRYLDATEVTARIESLAAEFPELAEIVELPYETNGYRRKAMALLGSQASSAVVLTTTAWGHEGGNDVTVELVDPGAASSPLSVSVDGTDVTVSLATGEDGAVTSTAADVVQALGADPESSDVLVANTYRGSQGGGVVAPAARTAFSDYLDAPDSVSREPFTVKAIRIGERRDGSKTGVLAYSQEYAREWVTPLVALEAAERLLRNAKTDAETKKLLRDLDIFIIPVVNPDGSHYSMYDYAFQRRNMVNYCGPDRPNDLLARNAWGVDLNRNFSVGSRLDGYSGASGSCTSDVYSGPAELSEPEARNEVWLTDTFPNIEFSMNIHSHGGYFMWAPGAYRFEGRETLPRPSLAEEDFFWASSSTILSRIQEHRGTAIWPGRTGPVADVLYSAAGNSADEHWYTKGIYAWNFEVGAPLWDDESERWQSVGFIPPFEEGYEESQEFAAGIIGMLEVARSFGRDRTPPSSTVVERDGGITFETSEPATVHYTLDGSRPTHESPRLGAADTRDGAETVELPAGSTTVRWFSVDPAGNVEGRYRPNGNGQNYRSEVVTVP